MHFRESNFSILILFYLSHCMASIFFQVEGTGKSVEKARG